MGSRFLKAMALGAAILLAGFGAVTLAAVLDNFGPPPAGDPSAHTGPLIGVQWAIDFLDAALTVVKMPIVGFPPRRNSSSPRRTPMKRPLPRRRFLKTALVSTSAILNGLTQEDTNSCVSFS